MVDSQCVVREWDEGNNSSHTTVDVEAPIELDVSPANDACSNQSIVPSVQVTPAGTTLQATLDGVEYQWGIPIVEEGDHELVVSALNACGGIGTSRTLHYTIDQTDPVVRIDGVEEGSTYPEEVTPTFVATDLHMADTTALLNGNPYVNGTPITDPGDYTLSVMATDCSGNAGEAVVHFTVAASGAPPLPAFLSQVAWFGCDSLNVNGHVQVASVTSLDGQPGFGGHIASNGSITVTGSNLVNGNATPGPGEAVTIVGNNNQVLGTTTPAVDVVPCDEQAAADWLAYATDHNDNGLIPAQFLDNNDNFKLNGRKDCTLPGGVYLVQSFTINGTGTLAATGQVVFVVTGAITINGSCKVNEGGLPANLTFISASTQRVLLNGSADVSLILFAPLAQVTVNGNLEGYGNLCGKTVTGNGGVVWNRLDAPEGRPQADEKMQPLQAH
jgi:cytoskeletal protein CcmA (bactofilin family)